jgi:hypothetical protein
MRSRKIPKKYRKKQRNTKRIKKNKLIQIGGIGIKKILTTLFLGLFLRTNMQNTKFDVNEIINEYIENYPETMIGENNADFVSAWENSTNLNYCNPSVLAARDTERLRERQLETSKQFNARSSPYVFGGPPSTFGTSGFSSDAEREIMLNMRKRKRTPNKRRLSDDSEPDEISVRPIDARLVDMTCDNDALLEYIKNELELEESELSNYVDELREILDRLNLESSNGKLDLSIPTTLALVQGLISILSKTYRLADKKGKQKKKLTYEQKSKILEKIKEINPNLFTSLSDDVIIDLLGAGLGRDLIESSSQSSTSYLQPRSLPYSQDFTYYTAQEDIIERPDLRDLISQIRDRITSSVDRVVDKRETDDETQIILITQEDINDIIASQMERVPEVIKMSDYEIDELVDDYISSNPRLIQFSKRRKRGDNDGSRIGGRRNNTRKKTHRINKLRSRGRR